MAPPERFHGAITRQLRGSGPRQTAPVARPHTADQRNALTAALPGWAVDAFDFIVVLVYADIATDFGTSKEKVAFLTTVTLLMRPVGALVRGIWADRIGRRTPLVVDVPFYSIVGSSARSRRTSRC